MEKNDNLLAVIKTVLSYLKYVFAICFVVGIGSIIISLLLPVYYQASTVFVAASPESLSERGIFGTTTRDPQPFGNDNDNDRLLTLANSNELIDFLVDSFHLYHHYDIDSLSPKAAHYIREEFNGLYEVTKTKRDAIQLSIEDKDPILAQQIANTARDKIDDMNLRATRAMNEKQILTLEQGIQQKTQRIQQLGDTLKAITSRYGIYNVESQSESLSDLIANKKAQLAAAKAKLRALQRAKGVKRDTITYLKANVAGLEQVVSQLDSTMLQLNTGMPIIKALQEEYDEAISQLSFDKERLQKLQATLGADISSIVLFEAASKPLIKSRPVRSIIVLGSVFAAFIISLLGVLIFDTYKEVDWAALLKS